MKHRWKRAVLALVLAALFCVSLTACEVQEETDTVGTDNSTYTCQYGKNENNQWVVTRTYKTTHVEEQLTTKNNAVCLYQEQVVANPNASNNETITQVSLQYAFDAEDYFATNSLGKLNDTKSRRYVIVTFDYSTTGAGDANYVTIKYETEGNGETPTGTIYQTSYTMTTVGTDKSITWDEGDTTVKSNTKPETTFGSYTAQSIINAALKVALGHDATDSIGDNLYKLSTNAKDSADTILKDTKAERYAQTTTGTTTNNNNS
jgi:hypothetical protein